MPKINLTLSPEHKLYTLPVTFYSAPKFMQGVAIFDSGSAGTSITSSIASGLDIEVSSLPRKPVSGVTGIKQTPVIMKIDIILPSTKVVTLNDVTILEDVHKEDVRRKHGILVSREVIRAAVPNLLGLDFLKELGGTLVISPAKNEAYIEW